MRDFIRVAAGLGLVGIGATATAAPPPFAYGGLTWTVDRYTADNYALPVSIYGRTDVLQIDIGPNGYADNRPGGFSSQFYSTQGIKADTGLPGGEAFASIDLYMPSAWNFDATATTDATHQGNTYGDFTTVGLWGQVDSDTASQNGFPILRFRNAGEVPGNYVYGYDDNTGNNIPSAGAAINWDGWNNIRIEYRGDRYDYYFNGVLVAQYLLVDGSGQTLVDDPTNALAFIFLNVTTNNVSPETYYWSALDYGLIAIAGEDQTLTTNLNGSIEAESGGTMTLAPTVQVTGNAVVESGGTIDGGTIALPYQILGTATVEAGGTLGGDGTVFGGLFNAGTIAPGNSPGILASFGYDAAPGATATMEADLSAAVPVPGTTHDEFIVIGNSTGATTAVTVSQINAPNAGVPTTGLGHVLVEVTGTVAPDAFELDAPVFSGGYQYLLNYIPDAIGTNDAFVLQSVIREELYGNAALLAAGQAAFTACFRGEGITANQGTVGRGRAWAKYVTGNRETGADTGIETDQDFSCGVGGIDFASNPDLRLGLSGGLGTSTVDVMTPNGVARLDGDLGAIEAYAAYERGYTFMNLTAGYSTADWTFEGPVTAPVSATVDGFVASAQIGVRWELGSSMRVGFIGEVDYDGTSCGDDCLLAGTSEVASEWRGALSARLDGSFSNGGFAPFVAVSYSDDLDGGNEASFGSAVVVADTSSNLFGARAGFDARIADGIGLFADAGVTEGVDRDVTGYDGQAGLKVYW